MKVRAEVLYQYAVVQGKSMASDQLVGRVDVANVTAAGPNLTISETPPAWNSKPMYQLPPWGEPLV